MDMPITKTTPSQNLNYFAKQLLHKKSGDFWEDETRALPYGLARARKKYKDFADSHIRPIALQADANLDSIDKEELFRKYVKAGFATEFLPRPLGNMSLSFMKHKGFPIALKVEELCAACPGIAIHFLGNELGMVPLWLSGSPAVFARWIAPAYFKLKTGRRCAYAFAITEPGAGSDVEDTHGSRTARAVTRADKVKNGYIINGSKVFITGGAFADHYTVFAKLGNEGMESWTCFVVERSRKGVSVGKQEKKMGQKAADASEVIFEDVFVPAKNIVGKERSGWALNKLTLNFSRPMVAAIALGVARNAFETCLDFCKKTDLGSKPLIEHQDVQIELADMMIQIMAARSMIWNLYRMFMPPMQATSAACKVFAADTAVSVCAKAMDIMGEHAYIHANGVEKSMRDARVTQIYEGTNQINRLALFEDLWGK